MALHDNMTPALRLVALFEAANGFLVLFAGLALFSLFHQNIQRVAEQLVTHLHLNPAHHIPKIFIEAAANLTDGRIVLFALLGAPFFSLSPSAVRCTPQLVLWLRSSP